MNYQKLFDHMNKEHGLTLLESELQDICNLVTPAKNELSVYEYIWSKVFPNEQINYDDLNDWCSENANRAILLAFEYYDNSMI